MRGGGRLVLLFLKASTCDKDQLSVAVFGKKHCDVATNGLRSIGHPDILDIPSSLASQKFQNAIPCDTATMICSMNKASDSFISTRQSVSCDKHSSEVKRGSTELRQLSYFQISESPVVTNSREQFRGTLRSTSTTSTSMNRSVKTSRVIRGSKKAKECPFCGADMKKDLPKHIMSCRKKTYAPIFNILPKNKPSRPNLEKVFGNKRGEWNLKGLADKHGIDIKLMHNFVEAMYKCHLLGIRPANSDRRLEKRKLYHKLVLMEETTKKARTTSLQEQLQMPYQRFCTLLERLNKAKRADNIVDMFDLDLQYPCIGSVICRQTEHFWQHYGNELIIETRNFVLSNSKDYQHRRYIEKRLLCIGLSRSKLLIRHHKKKDDSCVTSTRHIAFHAIVSNYALDHTPFMKSWLSRTLVAHQQYPLPLNKCAYQSDKLFGKRLIPEHIPDEVGNFVQREWNSLNQRVGWMYSRKDTDAFVASEFHPLLYFSPTRECSMLNLAKLHFRSSSPHDLKRNGRSSSRSVPVLCKREVQKLFPNKQIDFVNQAIVEVPSCLLLIAHLEELNLSYNNIRSLPDDICQLHCLKSLEFSDNRLVSLPAKTGNLSKLERIDLANNGLPARNDWEPVETSMARSTA
eukprot:jgi/Bigna1/75451/fgenesh1_pg.34_\